jgi:hypothetical protein
VASHGGRRGLDEAHVREPVREWSWDADDRNVERLEVVLVRCRSVAARERFGKFAVADVTNMASPGPQRRDALSSDLETDTLGTQPRTPASRGEPDIPLPDHRDFGVASFNSPEQVTGHEFSGQVDGTRECNDGRTSTSEFAPVGTRPR